MTNIYRNFFCTKLGADIIWKNVVIFGDYLFDNTNSSKTTITFTVAKSMKNFEQLFQFQILTTNLLSIIIQFFANKIEEQKQKVDKK